VSVENALQWKRGDTLPSHRVQLTERDPDVDPTPANPTPRRGIDLTNATSVTLVASTRNRRLTVEVPCTKDADQSNSLDPDQGRGWISVTPTTELTEQAANMQGEFLVAWSGGGQQRVPNSGYVDVLISEAFS
jgi:hypothetical protein